MALGKDLTPEERAVSLLQEVKRLSSRIQTQDAVAMGLTPRSAIARVTSEEELITKQVSSIQKIQPVEESAKRIEKPPYLPSPSFFVAGHARNRSGFTAPSSRIPSNLMGPRDQSLATQDARIGQFSPLAQNTPKQSPSPVVARSSPRPTTALADSPCEKVDEEIIEFKMSESTVDLGGKESLWNNQNIWEKWPSTKKEEDTVQVSNEVVKDTLCELEATQQELFGKPLTKETREEKERVRSPQKTRRVTNSPLRSPVASPTYEVEDGEFDLPPRHEPEMKITGLAKETSFQSAGEKSNKSFFHDNIRKVKGKKMNDTEDIEILRERSKAVNTNSDDSPGLSGRGRLLGLGKRHKEAPEKTKIMPAITESPCVDSETENTQEMPKEKEEQTNPNSATHGLPVPSPLREPPDSNKNSGDTQDKGNQQGRVSCVEKKTKEHKKEDLSNRFRSPLRRRSKGGSSSASFATRNDVAVVVDSLGVELERSSPEKKKKKKRNNKAPLGKRSTTSASLTKTNPLKISGLESTENVEVQSGCPQTGESSSGPRQVIETPMSLYDSEGKRLKSARKKGLFGRSPSPVKRTESSETDQSSQKFRLRFPWPKSNGRSMSRQKSNGMGRSVSRPRSNGRGLFRSKSKGRVTQPSDTTSDPVKVIPQEQVSTDATLQSEKDLSMNDFESEAENSIISTSGGEQNALVVHEKGCIDMHALTVGRGGNSDLMDAGCMDLHPMILGGKNEDASKTDQVVLYPLLDYNPCHGDLLLSPELEENKFDFDRLEKNAPRELLEGRSTLKEVNMDNRENEVPINSETSNPEAVEPIHGPAGEKSPTVLEMERIVLSTESDVSIPKRNPVRPKKAQTQRPGLGNMIRRAFANRYRKPAFPVHFPVQNDYGASDEGVEISFGTHAVEQKPIPVLDTKSCSTRPTPDALPAAVAKTVQPKAKKLVSQAAAKHKKRKGLTKAEKEAAKRLVSDLKLLSKIERTRRQMEESGSGVALADRVKSIEASLNALKLVDGLVRDRIRAKQKNTRSSKTDISDDDNDFFAMFSADSFSSFLCGSCAS